MKMKLIRHPDQVLVSAIWRAIEPTEKAKWSIVIETFFGKRVTLSGEAEPYKSRAHIAIKSVTIRHALGHAISIDRDTDHLQDSVSATPPNAPAPPAPRNASPGTQEARQYQEAINAHQERLKLIQESADSVDGVFSSLMIALGASAGDDDSRVEAVIERREAQLARFEQVTEDFMLKLEARRAELEAEFVRRKEELEQRSVEKLAETQKANAEETASERSKLTAEIGEAREQLRVREEAVAARESAADDSDNRAARRNLQGASGSRVGPVLVAPLSSGAETCEQASSPRARPRPLRPDPWHPRPVVRPRRRAEA